MELFFDSGATKCDAILLDDNGRYQRHCTGMGINATYMGDSDIHSILEGLRDQTGTEFQRLTFCGAGCGNPDNAKRIQFILQELYNINISNIEVISDLVGACRILSPGQSGMVAILGTGASACLTNNQTSASWNSFLTAAPPSATPSFWMTADTTSAIVPELASTPPT